MSLISKVLNKFKLTKLGAEAHYTEYEEVEGGVRLATEVIKTYPFAPNDTLTESFQELVPHLMMLCEIISEDTVADTKDVFELAITERFSVTGLVAKSTGVTLIGRRILRGKKVLNLTTPFLLWEQQDPTEVPYRYLRSLEAQIDIAVMECLRYTEGEHKHQAAYNAQLEIEFTEPPA